MGFTQASPVLRKALKAKNFSPNRRLDWTPTAFEQIAETLRCPRDQAQQIATGHALQHGDCHTHYQTSHDHQRGYKARCYKTVGCFGSAPKCKKPAARALTAGKVVSQRRQLHRGRVDRRAK